MAIGERVFISYSRKDKDFAQELHAELEKAGESAWVDWVDIPKSSDWWEQIAKGIEGADTFIFVLSPDSNISEVCQREVAHAASHNKRIIPLLYRELEDQSPIDEIGAINWIFFREEDDFKAAIEELIETIQTDLEWIEEHTRILVRAREWEAQNRNNNFLLQGDDIESAENWLAEGSDKEEQPTGLQREYILASRKNHKRRRRIIGAGIGIALIIAATFGVIAILNSQEADRTAILAENSDATAIAEANSRATAEAETVAEANAKAIAQAETVVEANAKATAQADADAEAIISQSRELSEAGINLADTELDLAMLLSIEGERTDANFLTLDGLNTVLRSNPQLSNFLHGHTDRVSSVAFSPDGKIVASGSWDNSIRLWDVETGEEIQVLEGHNYDVVSLEFSHEASVLISAGVKDGILFWDLQTGELIGKIDMLPVWMTCVTFSPDSLSFASATNDGTVIVWDLLTLEPLQVYEGDGNSVRSIAFSPDGNLLASARDDNNIRIWDLTSPTQSYRSFEGHTSIVRGVAFSPNGEYLASGSSDGTIKVWDIESGTSVTSTFQPIYHIMSVAFSPNGEFVAGGTDNNIIHFVDVETGAEFAPPLIDLMGETRAIAINPAGNILVSGSEDTKVRLWQLDQQLFNVTRFGDPGEQIWAVALSSDDDLIAGAIREELFVWDVQRNALTYHFEKIHEDRITDLAFDPLNKILASSSKDGTIRLWDMASGLQIGDPFVDIGVGLTSIAISKDGHYITAGCADEVVRVWDLETGEQFGEALSGIEGAVEVVAFSPNGKLVAGGGVDYTIWVWNIETGETVFGPLLEHGDAVEGLGFSSDGQMLLSSGWDQKIILWDMQTGELIGDEIRGHTEMVSDVAFSPDDEYFVSVSDDGMVQLWHTETHQPAGLPFSVGYYVIRDLDFSENGMLIAFGSSDGGIYLWDRRLTVLEERACQVAGRNFSQEEWDTYFPDEEYRVTCPQWPSLAVP